ncbi:hypothetical protein J6590_103025, partial [Homalodisca vitripennis]
LCTEEQPVTYIAVRTTQSVMGRRVVVKPSKETFKATPATALPTVRNILIT